MAATVKPDLSEFFKYSRPKKKPCAVRYASEQLSDDEKTQLASALAHDPGLITGSAIQQWLALRNHEVTISAVTSHRRGTCDCND